MGSCFVDINRKLRFQRHNSVGVAAQQKQCALVLPVQDVFSREGGWCSSKHEPPNFFVLLIDGATIIALLVQRADQSCSYRGEQASDESRDDQG